MRQASVVERVSQTCRSAGITSILLTLLSAGQLGAQPAPRDTPIPAAPPQPAPAEELSTLVVHLRYASAEEVANVLHDVFGHLYGDVLSFVPRSEAGVVIVAGPTRHFDEIGQIVKTVDCPPSDATSIRIFQLKNARPGEVCETIHNLIDGAECDFDDRTNSVIVTASSTAFLGVEQVVSSLDAAEPKVPTQREPDEIVRVFPLSRLRPGDPMPHMLNSILGDRGQWTVDEQRKQIVVRADPSVMDQAANYIALIDQGTVEPEGPPSMRVRLVWLVSGVDLERQPPVDLADVVKELGSHGVEDLRLAAQTMVETVAGENFTLSAAPVLEQACTLDVHGEIQGGDPGRPKLRLQLQATQYPASPPPGPPGRRLCRLETTVVAPLGHAVVLGVTPTGEMTSVFVLQILPE